MAQNQPYAQYPYYAQPQNIYQQLGKPQPQPHLQSAYQQQQQQQLVQVPQQQPYQYVYQQPPQSPFPGAPGYTPQQQQIAQQQQVYQYTQPGAPAPIQQAPAVYQRPPSQNSRIPTSSFPNLAPGQPVPNVLPRQHSHNPVINNANTSGQLVPTSQSLTLRGPTPAISPGPPISPSAMFAQQVQHQQQPSMALVPANRNSVVVPAQRQIMPPPQTQPQPQTQPHAHIQSQPQPQTQPQAHIQSQAQPQPPPQNQPPAPPPPQPQQQNTIVPAKTPAQRRPLPSPGASRTFPSVNTTATTTTPTSAIPNSSITRTSITQASTTSQPSSPTKTGMSSPTKAGMSSQTKTPSSPTKTSRPLPTPGGSGGGSNLAREGFAGIGAKQSSSRVTGLPVPETVSSLVAGITPSSLTILPLPDGSSSPDRDSEANRAGSPAKTGLPGSSSIQTGASSTAGSSDNGSLSKRRASPPRFQPSATSTPSPTKETPPSLPPMSHPSATASSSTTRSNLKSSSTSSFTVQSQSGSNTPNDTQTQRQTPEASPTKKFTPVWKRTIPEYPQPAFGYAAGMVSDPFVPSTKPPGSTSSPQKQSQTEMDRQRALVEKQHIERQLNAAMAQAYAQAQAQKKIAGMPVSNTSYSAYAMYSRSNPNLHQPSYHVRSGANDYDDDDEEEDSDEDSDDDEEDDEEDDPEETEEEREARRRKHRKKASESTVTGKKKKKPAGGKEKRVPKKAKKGTRSASAPPKKRMSRKDIPSTSEEETETTEVTGEEETEEEIRYGSRHAKSPSTSSSRFKAKVEKEKEVMRKKRSSQHNHADDYYDDEGTPTKRDLQLDRGRDPSPPQRRSYHQRNMSSGYTGFPRRTSPSPPPSHSGYGHARQVSPSPPPNHRSSRRVSPPRVSLLKDAQRRTVKLRGSDDDVDDRDRGRREELERWKRDERYRSREREPDRNGAYMERERYRDERRHTGNHHEDEYDYERVRQEERDMRFGATRANNSNNGPNSIPQPPTVTYRRDMDEREDWSRGGRRDERDSNSKIFFNRQGSPPRHPVRDSVFATGYRGRPASPTGNFPQQRQSSMASPPVASLMSPYCSRPSSPIRPTDGRGSGLVTKFSAINIHDRKREEDGAGTGGRGKNGEWPLDHPKLSRASGDISNASGHGYFDAGQRNSSRETYSSSGSRASAEFARMSGGRSSGMTDYDSGYADVARPLRRDAHNPHHHSNLDMNLDDPPPRSLSPAISQGPTTFGRTAESAQQTQAQQFNNRRPQSEFYTSTSTTHAMRHRKSYYGNTSNPPPQPPSPVKQRPQSQVYSRQPSRPPSVHPIDRANMNMTNINNGTPKVQTISIESPAPVGGRDKRADLDRMMSDPEDEGFAVNVSRINVSGGFDGGRQRRDADMDSPRGPPPAIQVDLSGGPVDSPRRPMIQVDSPRGPTIQVDSPRGPMIQIDSPQGPTIQIDSPRGPIINVDSPRGPTINIEEPHNNHNTAPKVQVYEVPGISIAGPEFDDGYSGQRAPHPPPNQQQRQQRQDRPRPEARGGLICGGCDGPIIGRIVSAMGARWHPQCFRCTICGELLEHVSSYEHDGRPYCHLDYHENFAPRCFSCKTAIIEERFISLDDPALGKRTYHEQHFFCAECGDPFLAPSMNSSTRTGELNVKGDGEFESDDVGFTVYKGHPYCEACHVRLRLPKCKKCKKSIRDHEQAVEALGGKWCWGCFVCASCEKPFENPSFFQRGDKPYCERCFDIMLRNEV